MRKSGKERKRRHELFCNGCEDLSIILNQRWEPFFCIQSEVTGKMIMIVSQTQLCVIMLWKVKEMVAVASKKVEEDLTKTSTSVQTRLWMQHVHVSEVLQLNSNQVKEGEGVDVVQGGHHQVQGGGQWPHLHPPLRHHLHSLHLPGTQRVTIRLKGPFELRSSLADATPCPTMRSQSLLSGEFLQRAWQFSSK